MGGSQSTGKVTKNDRAILDLKIQRDKLKQYQKRLSLALTAEQNAAKEALAAGNKARALTALRQRKYQENLLMKTDGQLQVITELLSTIEYSTLQNQILSSLQAGSQVLSELQKEMSLEKVEGIMEQIGEGVERQREIDEALMSKISPEEEEAVQAEFEALLKSGEIPSETVRDIEIRQKLSDRLPSVPAEVPVEEVEEAQENTKQRQRQREEDLLVAMTS